MLAGGAGVDKIGYDEFGPHPRGLRGILRSFVPDSTTLRVQFLRKVGRRSARIECSLFTGAAYCIVI